MTAVPESNAAELAALLSKLNDRAEGTEGHQTTSPTDAMELYRVATRLVELQLKVLERDARNPEARGTEEHDSDVEVTRDVLRGTRQMLLDALDGMTQPADSVVHINRRRRQRRKSSP